MHCKVLFLVEDKQNALEALTSRQNTKKKQPKNYPAGIYLFKVNNRNTRARCEIYSKLTIKTPE